MVGAQPAISSLTPITFKTRFARSRASPKSILGLNRIVAGMYPRRGPHGRAPTCDRGLAENAPSHHSRC